MTAQHSTGAALYLKTPPTPAPKMLSAAAVGKALGLSPYHASRLLSQGWISGRQDKVQALAQRALLGSAGPVALLQMGEPTISHEEAGDRKIGIGPDYTDEELLNAARMWWRCDPDAVLNAGVVLVCFSGFVMAVLQVHELEASERVGSVTRHAFTASLIGRVVDLAEGTVDVKIPHPAAMAIGTRLPVTPAGSPLVVTTLTP